MSKKSILDEPAPYEASVRPIGKQLYRSVEGKPDGTDLTPKNVVCSVVAVAENVHYESLHKPISHTVYLVDNPDQEENSFSNLFVRAAPTDLALTAIRQVANEVIPGADIEASPVSELVNHDLNRERMLVSLSGRFALLGLAFERLWEHGGKLSLWL